MADYRVRCSCGNDMVVSEWALGAPLRCTACGAALEATEKNARPVATAPKSVGPTHEAPSGRAAASPMGADAAKAQEPLDRSRCSRCGRAFRGDWDMNHRAGAILCHICANLSPEKPKEDEPLWEASVYADGRKEIIDVPAEEVQPGLTAHNPERDQRIRRWVIVAAAIVFPIALYVVFTTETVVPPEAAQSAEELEKMAMNLPPALGYSVGAVLFLFRFAALAVALYFILHSRNRLPRETLLGNALSLGMVAAVIDAIGIVIRMVPCLGLFLHVILAVYILWELYDLQVSDFILLLVLLVVLYPVLEVVRNMIVGTLVLVFT